MNGTIFALATAPGRAAVAVMRLSGPDAGAALAALAGPLPAPRRASLRTLRCADGSMIDHGLVLWFPGPASYTGEDCAELQVHGAPVVVDRLTQALVASGLRLAAPGEFTRRAFEMGKLDLDRAEAVADLIEAQTAAQARQAIGQLQGALGARHEAWRGKLLRILADLDAAVDFPDEEVPADVAARARAPLRALLAELDAALADQARGQRVREGYRIAVIGAPNAGKSTLFNALVEREAAIVTAIAGTTRDVIEASVALAGYQVLIADMAGLRATAEPIELAGVRRARAWAGGAALRLWVVDGAASAGDWRMAVDLVADGDLCLISKSDLPRGSDARRAHATARERGLEAISISLPGGNAGVLRARLAARVAADLAGAEFPAATRARHAALIGEARSDLSRAINVLAEPELAAEDVRRAASALSRITGNIGAEDVLDLVFSSFCIGK